MCHPGLPCLISMSSVTLGQLEATARYRSRCSITRHSETAIKPTWETGPCNYFWVSFPTNHLTLFKMSSWRGQAWKSETVVEDMSLPILLSQRGRKWHATWNSTQHCLNLFSLFGYKHCADCGLWNLTQQGLEGLDNFLSQLCYCVPLSLSAGTSVSLDSKVFPLCSLEICFSALDCSQAWNPQLPSIYNSVSTEASGDMIPITSKQVTLSLKKRKWLASLLRCVWERKIYQQGSLDNI